VCHEGRLWCICPGHSDLVVATLKVELGDDRVSLKLLWSSSMQGMGQACLTVCCWLRARQMHMRSFPSLFAERAQVHPRG
jgi:hypothetical protein